MRYKSIILSLFVLALASFSGSAQEPDRLAGFLAPHLAARGKEVVTTTLSYREARVTDWALLRSRLQSRAQAGENRRPAFYYAPQLAVGIESGLEITTVENFRNVSTTERASVLFQPFQPDGRSMGVMSRSLPNGDPIDTGSSLTSLSPGSHWPSVLSVHPNPAAGGGPGIHTGWAHYETTETWNPETETWEPDVQISVSYVIREVATGTVLAAVDTEVSKGRARHLLSLWEVTEPPSTKIGVAVSNPHEEAVEVTLRAIAGPDPDRLTTTFTLGPREQRSLFVSEYFADDPVAWPVWQEAVEFGQNPGVLYTTLEIEAALPVPVTALRSDGLIVSGWSVGQGRIR